MYEVCARLLLKYDKIDKLLVKTAIAWGHPASTKLVEVIDCDDKSDLELVSDNEFWGCFLAW